MNRLAESGIREKLLAAYLRVIETALRLVKKGEAVKLRRSLAEIEIKTVGSCISFEHSVADNEARARLLLGEVYRRWISLDSTLRTVVIAKVDDRLLEAIDKFVAETAVQSSDEFDAKFPAEDYIHQRSLVNIAQRLLLMMLLEAFPSMAEKMTPSSIQFPHRLFPRLGARHKNNWREADQEAARLMIELGSDDLAKQLAVIDNFLVYVPGYRESYIRRIGCFRVPKRAGVQWTPKAFEKGEKHLREQFCGIALKRALLELLNDVLHARKSADDAVGVTRRDRVHNRSSRFATASQTKLMAALVDRYALNQFEVAWNDPDCTNLPRPRLALARGYKVQQGDDAETIIIRRLGFSVPMRRVAKNVDSQAEVLGSRDTTSDYLFVLWALNDMLKTAERLTSDE